MNNPNKTLKFLFFKIADAADVTCRKFMSCDGPTIGTTTYDCTSPSVFNRNYGICTVASIAPCNIDHLNFRYS